MVDADISDDKRWELIPYRSIADVDYVAHSSHSIIQSFSIIKDKYKYIFKFVAIRDD